MKKYIEVIKVNIQIAMMYKWNMLISTIIDVFRVIAESAFWQIVFLSSGATRIYGYQLSEMLSYYIFMYIIGSFIGMGDIGYKVAEDIKSGALSQMILRPVNIIR